MKRILLVEDDPTIAEAISLGLNDMEFVVTHVAGGNAGMEQALSQNFDLIVLDVMLPEVSGLDICRKVREAKPEQPILMLTSCKDEIDIVLGLEQGADDYLTKPFRLRELVARIRSLLRRASTSRSTHSVSDSANAVSEKITLGILTLDIGTRQVLVNNEPIETTHLDFELLLYLFQKGGRAAPRDELVETVWGYTGGDYDITVNSHISKLRRKLGPAGAYIKTVRGFGYRIEASEDSGVLTDEPC